MQPWAPSPFEDSTGGEPWWRLAACPGIGATLEVQSEPSIVLSVNFEPDRGEPDHEVVWDYLVRTLCHVLVDRIPTKGLLELSETLAGMFEFYATERVEHPLLPRITTVTAAQGSRYTRPEFHLDEE